VYFGGWWGEEELPAEFQYTNGRPERRGIVTRAGHSLVFTDEADAERIRLLWHKPDDEDEALADPTKTADRTLGKFAFLSFNPDGSIQLVNANGSNINIDATNKGLVLMDEHGNTATLDEEGIGLVDKDGNFISMGGGEVTIMGSSKAHLISPTLNLKAGTIFVGDGALQPAVLGTALLTWLNAHTHPVAGPATGPAGAGAPGPALPSTLLSSSVRVK
jgi:hypothetical protein